MYTNSNIEIENLGRDENMENEVKILNASNNLITFQVPSSRDGVHIVTYNVETSEWKCTCEHYCYRGAYCKHMRKAQRYFESLATMMGLSNKTVIYNSCQQRYQQKLKGEA